MAGPEPDHCRILVRPLDVHSDYIALHRSCVTHTIQRCFAKR
jgi:hypothetical protein